MAVEDKHKKNRFSVKILGEELVVVGDISEKYVSKLVEYINQVGEDITRAYPRLPRRRILGLTMINIADEYFKLKENYNKDMKLCEKLKDENRLLQEQMSSLRKEYKELLALLEEVD